MKQLLATLILLALLLTCCKKPDPPAAKVRFVAGIPVHTQMKMYVDGKLKSPSVWSDLSEYQALVDPGTHHLLIQTAQADTVVIDTSCTLEPGGYYTIVASRVQNSGYWGTIVRDDLSTPEGERIGIRFFHLASRAGSVDVFADAQRLGAKRVFADIGVNPAFARFIVAPIKRYGRAPDFYLLKSGTTDTLGMLKKHYDWRPGQLLTVILMGAKNQADSSGFELMLFESNRL